MRALLFGLLAALMATIGLALPGLTGTASANANINIEFPVAPSAADQFNWVDTWHAPRPGGRLHLGTDVFGPKSAPLVAVETGSITWGRFKNDMPLGGNFIEITGQSGRRYYYTHLNNDTPGTDDGAAKCNQVFPAKVCRHVDPGTGEIRANIPVTAGEFIGFNGDSGNAEPTPAHIHFEVLVPNGRNTNNGNRYDIEVRNDDWTEVNPAPILDRAYDRLVNNISPATLAQDTASEEAQLTRLYYTFFNRAPDNSGYRYWLNQIESGVTVSDIAIYFEASGEFSKRFSNDSNKQYIDFLYNAVLKRQADVNGKQYWVTQLRAGTLQRNTIVNYFAQGEELTTKLKKNTEAVTAYNYHLGRTPTRAEIADWKQLRQTRNVAQTINLVFS